MNSTVSETRRAFGVIGAGAGAVLEKEMRAQGRRWGTYIARSALTALLLGAFVLLYLAVSDDASRAHGAQKIQALQQFAPALSIGILWVQFVMVVLVAPVLTGPSICDERRTGTLAALLTTPLGAAHIVLGKLFGTLVQLFVLALLPTPLLLVVRVFGGLDVETVLAGFVLSMTMGLLAASLGMFFSTRMRRGAAAGAAGLISTMAFHGPPALVMGILTGTNTFRIPFDVIFSSSSPAVLVLLSANLFGDMPPLPFNLRTCWMASASYSLVISLVTVSWTIVSLRRTMRNFEESAASKASTTRKRKNGRATGQDKRDSEDRHARVVGDQPVLWRELRQSFFGSWKRVAIVLGAIVAVISWAYYEIVTFAGPVDELVVHGFTIGVGTFVTLVLAAVLPAGLIGVERESRTLDTLLASRLTTWQVVSGKAIGSLRRQLFFPSVVLAELAVGAFVIFNVRPILLLHYAMIVVPVVFFLACTGVLAGTVLRRSVHAMVANLAICVIFWLALPVGFELMVGLMGGWGGYDAPPEQLLKFINPVFMVVTAAESGMHSIRSYNYQAGSFYRPFNADMNTAEFTALLLAFAGMYIGLGLGAMRLASMKLRGHFAGA